MHGATVKIKKLKKNEYLWGALQYRGFVNNPHFLREMSEPAVLG